jgi:DNA-binding transcriptional ArsR family regulator
MGPSVLAMDKPESRTAIAALANALGDDTRLRLVASLIDADPAGLTVTDLAERLNLAQPRISTHLAILKDAGLVDSRPSGRARIYRAVTTRAAPILDALSRVAGVESTPRPSPAALREISRNSPYRNARTCYDHMAGLAAVDLLDGFIFDRWLVRAGGPDERPSFDITGEGRNAFSRLGIDMDAVTVPGRRVVACGCLDWTERRPHLAGRLGAAVLERLEADGIVQRKPESRQLVLARPLDDWLARA